MFGNIALRYISVVNIFLLVGDRFRFCGYRGRKTTLIRVDDDVVNAFLAVCVNIGREAAKNSHAQQQSYRTHAHLLETVSNTHRHDST